MNGGDGNDRLIGDYRDMYGGNGNDYLSSNFSGNQYGGNGDDTLDGDDGSQLDGGTGNDVLYVSYSSGYGGDGDDVLTGNHARMSGGRGNDTINGGSYNFYVFNAPSEGVDTITNFSPDYGVQIVVSANGFGGGLTAGAAITPEQFRIGTAAADASDRFIYNNANGALFFDPTGSKNCASDQVLFATLVGAPGITSNDIVVDA
jgi:Ca2+-binding RTX toxin-like protein